MIVWVVAGLLALATGLRIGWALVNRQSVVSSAMIVALGSLAVLTALNWPPLTRLVDAALGWPNISDALSQVALIAAAAGSCVMITSVATGRSQAATRRLAAVQYGIAAVVAAVALALFFGAGRQPQMTPQEYLSGNGGAVNGWAWLLPLLYVVAVLAVVAWVGLRLSDSTRRGRALFVFAAGVALIAVAVAFLRGGVGPATIVLLCALAVVAAGAMLPAIEDWAAARRELRMINPLLTELKRRHRNLGIGERPRGPLAFRVAEQLSLISDGLYLEAATATVAGGPRPDDSRPGDVSPREQADVIAGWIRADESARFPGDQWLRQPPNYSDRDWILEIARSYGRKVSRRTAQRAAVG